MALSRLTIAADDRVVHTAISLAATRTLPRAKQITHVRATTRLGRSRRTVIVAVLAIVAFLVEALVAIAEPAIAPHLGQSRDCLIRQQIRLVHHERLFNLAFVGMYALALVPRLIDHGIQSDGADNVTLIIDTFWFLLALSAIDATAVVYGGFAQTIPVDNNWHFAHAVFGCLVDVVLLEVALAVVAAMPSVPVDLPLTVPTHIF